MVSYDSEKCKISRELDEILEYLHPISFKDISSKPDLDKIRREAWVLNPFLDEEDIKRDYRDKLKYFRSKRGLHKKLCEYGANRNEIVDRLSEHVGSCPYCRTVYSKIAEDWTDEMIVFLNNHGSDSEILGEVVNEDYEEDYNDLLKEFDMNLLRLFF